MKRALAVLALAIAATSTWADDDNSSGFRIKPSVIQSTDGGGATLALDYSIKGAIQRPLAGSDAGSPDIGTSSGAFQIAWKGSGTIAADKDKNPRDFLDILGDLSFAYGSLAGDFSAGGFVKYEADQSFSNKQSVYGARLTYAKIAMLAQSDEMFVDLHYGQVDPSKDSEREAAGADPKKKYYRSDFEAYYMYPLKWNLLRRLELNYRYFRETSPPEVITAAHLETHILRIVRLGLMNDFFVAYSTGRLPFDHKDDKAVQLGWSYKLPPL